MLREAITARESFDIVYIVATAGSASYMRGLLHRLGADPRLFRVVSLGYVESGGLQGLSPSQCRVFVDHYAYETAASLRFLRTLDGLRIRGLLLA